MTIAVCFKKKNISFKTILFFFRFNLFLLNYFTFKISTNVIQIQIHVKTEVIAMTKTDLSPVRVVSDGQGRCVKSVSISFKGMG